MFNLGEINGILTSIKTEPSEAHESETIEFKEYAGTNAFFNKSQDVVRELSAFANKSGGTLIVGVKDSSNVTSMDWESQLVGFEEIDCLDVEKRVKGNLRPSVPLEVINHRFEEKNYLLIRIPKINWGLVMTASGKCYMRSGRDSNPMTPQEVEDKVKSLNGYDWSAEIMESIDPKEALDDQQIEEAMAEFHSLKELGEMQLPQEHFLEKIGVTSNGQLTKGGLLFLGKPEVIRSSIGNMEYRFSKLDKGGKIPINDVWSGSLWTAIARIRELLKQVIEYDEFVYDDKTYRFPNICIKAFEEALVNSLVHRDYALDGLTTVEIKDNSLLFLNPGNFFGGITGSNIFTHPPRHRNPWLATILMNLELVDRAGMGTRRMNIESLRFGRREPKFTSKNNYVSTSFELGSVKEGVFVTVSPYEDYDVTELFLINLLYGKGYEEINAVLEMVSNVVLDPWREVNIALKRISCLSLVGNKDGIFIEVSDSHSEILSSYRKVKVYQSSEYYVSIFNYLYDRGEASSSELCGALNLKPLSKVQRLLREAKFIKKIQNGTEITWRLVDHTK